MTTKNLLLISRINEELSELQTIFNRIKKAWDNYINKADPLYLDSVALNLHGFYTCIELIFELIAKNVDQSIPLGDSWHQELLRQMVTEIKSVRPPVISRDTYVLLNEYRGFRHVVRNVYTYNISEKKLAPLINDLEITYKRVKDELEQFISLLEE